VLDDTQCTPHKRTVFAAAVTRDTSPETHTYKERPLAGLLPVMTHALPVRYTSLRPLMKQQ